MTDRFRHLSSIGRVPSNQIAHLSSSPMAAPTIAVFYSDTSADGEPIFVFNITMNRERYGDTDGVALNQRAVMDFHWETTAEARLDPSFAIVAGAGNTSGLSAIGEVLPGSTGDLGTITGKIICSSTGVCTLQIVANSGGATTGILVLTLPNGLIATSTRVIFST